MNPSHNPLSKSSSLPMFKSGLAALALGLAINQASASLTLDLRATQTVIGGVTTNQSTTTFNSGLTTVSGLSIGDTVTFTLYAYVHSELNNPEDGDSGLGTTNFQGFQNAFGSILQGLGGGAHGTWTSVAQNTNSTAGAGGMVFLTAQYGGAGNQQGTIQDLNADGFSDFGANATVPTNTSLIFARAGSMQTTNGGGAQALISLDGLTTRIRIGTCKLTISGATSSAPTSVAWRNVNFPAGSDIPALWREDNLTRNSKASGGTILTGAGVTLIAIPEPAAFGMLLLGGVGLVGFRRLGIRKA